jgi:hypothetical protein
LLQDDIAKFVSDPASPPRLVNITEEGKGKERHEQHHLQTLPGTSQRLGSEDGDVAYISREFS